MKKYWLALLLIPLLVGCRNIVERPETHARLLLLPKAPQPAPADHAYALAYADLVHAGWIQGTMAQQRDSVLGMEGRLNSYLNMAAASELDVYAWPPQREARNAIYTSRATDTQDSITRTNRFINSLDCEYAQLLMQSFAEQQSGRAIEAGHVPIPPR